MRMRTLAVLAAAVVPAAAHAQARTEPALQQESATLAAPALAAEPGIAPPAGPEAAPVAAFGGARTEARAASGTRRALFTLGGAVVGAWAGYLGSQVTRSDWDKQDNGDFSSYRAQFTVGGAAIGALTGLLVGRGGNGEPVSRARPAILVRDANGSRDEIALVEIQRSQARSALELVQELRPLWLQKRGIQNPGETGRASSNGRDLTVIPGTGGVMVYLDNARVGEVDALREIPVSSLSGARFLDAAAATQRFGGGHPHGAIVLLTARTRANP
jgi:hypothetical protein